MSSTLSTVGEQQTFASPAESRGRGNRSGGRADGRAGDQRQARENRGGKGRGNWLRYSEHASSSSSNRSRASPGRFACSLALHSTSHHLLPVAATAASVTVIGVGADGVDGREERKKGKKELGQVRSCRLLVGSRGDRNAAWRWADPLLEN